MISVLKWAAAVLANVFVVILLIRAFRYRNALLIREVGESARKLDVSGRELASTLRTALERIWKAHKSEALSAAGESTNLADPRSVSEDLGSKALQFMAGNSPVGFLVDLSSYVWSTLELEGEVVVGEDWTNVWGVRLRRGNKYYHGWRTELSEEGVDEAVEELAHRIAMDTGRLGVLQKGEKKWGWRGRSGAERTHRPRSTGTRNWRAFRALTEAMALWNHPDYSPTNEEDVAAVDAKLAEAIQHDPGYALALYNRGTLHLTTFSTPTANDRALQYFEKALAAATNQVRDASQVKVQVDHRVRGMAHLGIARSCSQAVHRYGRTDENLVKRAREAADEATIYLNQSHESLYAKAFAWHCTETYEDIRVGREVYEEIIEEAPRKYSSVHNNLGYILVKGGEHLMKRGQEKKARKWWKDAEEQLKITIELEGHTGRWEFAYANLGDLYRLQGRFQDGEREYLKALAPDPRKSTYTNGLNELAVLYRDWGQETSDPEKLTKAKEFHDLALATTTDEGVREKLRAQFQS